MPFSFRPFSRFVAVAVAVLGLSAGSRHEARAAEKAFTGPETVGRLEAPPRRETSGIAASRRSPGVWWVHDDSGGAAALHAVDDTGKKVGALRFADLRNRDWEDLAAFAREGKAWLLIADTGDNEGDRANVMLHVVEEPARETLTPARETPARAAWTLRVRYEDGARDCEAVAVDATEGAVYLLTKRDDVPRLYRVPLAASTTVVTARLAGTVPAIPKGGPGDELFKAVLGKRYAWPTAMDFASDGSKAVVLTYGDVLVFRRAEGESWAAAFARTPLRFGYHGFPQAEGVAFSVDGSEIRVVSEGVPDIARYVLKK